MLHQSILLAIVGCALISGLHSPVFLPIAVGMAGVLLPSSFFVENVGVVFLSASLLATLMSIVAGGIPAAIYERITDRTRPDTTAMLIWLVSTFALSLPAIVVLFQVGF